MPHYAGWVHHWQKLLHAMQSKALRIIGVNEKQARVELTSPCYIIVHLMMWWPIQLCSTRYIPACAFQIWKVLLPQHCVIRCTTHLSCMSMPRHTLTYTNQSQEPSPMAGLSSTLGSSFGIVFQSLYSERSVAMVLNPSTQPDIREKQFSYIEMLENNKILRESWQRVSGI